MSVKRPMSGPLTTPQAMGKGPTAGSGLWTAEIVAGLDWMRLSELLRAIASNAGCRLGPSRVEADGRVQFAMLERPGNRAELRSLVRVLGWNVWGATPEEVETFARELGRIREPTRGVLVAPGGCTQAAMMAALKHGMELVDAERLAETLRALPEEQTRFLHELTLSPGWQVPSCPLCLRKLRQVTQPVLRGPVGVAEQMVFQVSSIVPDAVHCRMLEVMREVEVRFLQPVWSRMMILRGHVTGHFVCDGPVVLDPGARLEGSVAARSIKVHPGADLVGQAQILAAEAQCPVPDEGRWFWRCVNGEASAECRRIVFHPHG
jgi:hypothetical protein